MQFTRKLVKITKLSFPQLFNWGNTSSKMVENEQMQITAMEYQISISHISSSITDIELKFSVSRSIMIYNIWTKLEQIWRRSSWKVQDT